MKNLRVFLCMYVCLPLVFHVAYNLKNVVSAFQNFGKLFRRAGYS